MTGKGVAVFGVFQEPDAIGSIKKSTHGLVVRFGREFNEEGLRRYDWPTFSGKGKLLGIFYNEPEARAWIERHEAS